MIKPAHETRLGDRPAQAGARAVERLPAPRQKLDNASRCVSAIRTTVRKRRVSLIPVRSDEGRLTESTTVVQPLAAGTALCAPLWTSVSHALID